MLCRLLSICLREICWHTANKFRSKPLRAKKVIMKGSSWKRKIDLVNKMNPEWKDLFGNLKENEIEDLLRIKNHYK